MNRFLVISIKSILKLITQHTQKRNKVEFGDKDKARREKVNLSPIKGTLTGMMIVSKEEEQ